MLSRLSAGLVSEMHEDIFGEFLLTNRVLSRLFSPELLKRTMSLVEEIVKTPGEFLFKQGEADDQSMYFLFEGKVELTLNEQTVELISATKNSKA